MSFNLAESTRDGHHYIVDFRARSPSGLEVCVHRSCSIEKDAELCVDGRRLALPDRHWAFINCHDLEDTPAAVLRKYHEREAADEWLRGAASFLGGDGDRPVSTEMPVASETAQAGLVRATGSHQWMRSSGFLSGRPASFTSTALSSV